MSANRSTAPSSGGRTVRRRDCFRAAGGSVCGLVAAGCAGARPTAAVPVVTLIAALDVTSTMRLGTVRERTQLYEQSLHGFTAARRGVAVRIVPYAPTPVNAAAILAGTAPDVFADVAGSYATYVEQELLLPLDAYLQRDNLPTSLWSPTVIDALRTPGGLFAMSRGEDSYLYALNLSLFDRHGIPYPATTWTQDDLARVATHLTSSRGGVHRYGLSLQGGPGGFLGALGAAAVGFGGSVSNAARDRQTLTSPACVRAVEWLAGRLLGPGVAVSGSIRASLLSGNVAIQEIQQVDLLNLYQQWRDNFKWVLYPPPRFPARRAGGAAANFWAAAGSTRHPEAAWALLRWLSAEAPFQRFFMKSFLMPPALNRLMPQWRAVAESVVPGLKGKGIQWFTASTDGGWGVSAPWFASANAQVQQIDSVVWTEILTHKVSIHAGLRQADAQTNAVLAAAARAPAPSLRQRQAASAKAERRRTAMFAAAAGRPVPPAG